MTRYVIGPDVAIHLADGEMDKRDAQRRLDCLRGLRIRLLGDRVLQNVAWKVADQS